ncbi:MAG: zf-TFIIB domain-containing protein [Rubrivivax sp.]
MSDCPSCRRPMESHRLPGRDAPVELDICFTCQGLWLDHGENLRLTGDGVVQLFGLLHQHRSDERQPVGQRLGCPRCTQPLAQGFDVVRSGRYITHRCGQRHGRFSLFSSFMVEKGFVRQLSSGEVKALAQKMAAIYCSGCGAPVDIRQNDSCPYCRTAFSLLDPDAVRHALQAYREGRSGAAASPPSAAAGTSRPSASAEALADSLVAIERERSRAERERQSRGLKPPAPVSGLMVGDLVAAGVATVWAVLSAGDG